MASRRRLLGSDRNDLLPGGGDLADKSRRNCLASGWRFVRRRPVSACLVVVVVASVSAALVATVRHVPLPGVARQRDAADAGMEVVPSEDDMPTRLLPPEGGQAAAGAGTPPIGGAGGVPPPGNDGGGGGSTGGDNGRDVVPAAAPVMASDGGADDAAADAGGADAAAAGAPAGASDVTDNGGVGDGDGDGVKANPNWDGGGVEGGATGDTDGASLGMGSVDGDGAASAEGAAGGDGADGEEAGDGPTGTARTDTAAAPAAAAAAPNAGVPLDRALAQTTDLSAQVALMSSAPCVRLLQTGSLGSTTPLCITGEYFLDVQVTPGAPTERLTVAIFGHAVPKSAVNWHALATCAGGVDDEACFRNDSFHRVVPKFVIQGGNRGTGRSVFGSTFREEVSAERHSVLSHSARGVLAWAEYPIGSQFYILMADAAVYLDANHVVFGIVVDGLDVAEKVQTQPLVNGAPEQRVSIVSAGLLDRAAPGPVAPPGVGPSADAAVGPNAPPFAAAAAAAAGAPAAAAVRLGEPLPSGGNPTAGGDAEAAAAGAGTAATVNGNGTTDGDALSDGERGAGEEGGTVDEPPVEGEPARVDAGVVEPPAEWESARADAADDVAADGETRAAAARAVPEVPPGQASEGV